MSEVLLWHLSLLEKEVITVFFNWFLFLTVVKGAGRSG